MPLLWTLSRFQILFSCFDCWLWPSKCQLCWRPMFLRSLTRKFWKSSYFFSLFVCLLLFFFSLWAIIINNTSIKSTKTSKKLPRKVFLRQARNCPIRLFLWFIYLFNLVPSIYKLVFFLVKNFCYSRNYWALFVW